jgi:phosphate-selective porin OprO/OprP
MPLASRLVPGYFISVAAVLFLTVSVQAAGPASPGSEPAVVAARYSKPLDVRPGMLLQLDSAWYDSSDTEFEDGTELRRARLNAGGTVLRDVEFRVEADFSGLTQDNSAYDVTLQDAWLRYHGIKPFSVTAGNFKIPFGLEALSGSRNLTFMERGLPAALLNQRAPGAMVAAHGERWSVAAGGFGATLIPQTVDDEGHGVAARTTVAPLSAPGRALHLGFGIQWRKTRQRGADGNRTVRFRSRPESNLTDDDRTASAFSLTGDGYSFGVSPGRVVDTGDIGGGVDDYLLLGGEGAAVFGPLSLQIEYIRSWVSLERGDDPHFDGWYATASWFLTGESRNYRPDKGVFEGVQPVRPLDRRRLGIGAWEIAARYSGLDLSNTAVLGGDMHDMTIGLNWYPNAFVRVMANYVKVLDINGGANHDESLDTFQLRAQVAY